MFGGKAWFLNGNMCIGVHNKSLILRCGDLIARELLMEPHVGPMDITGRIMKGWVMVDEEGTAEDRRLAYFVQRAIDFVVGFPPK